MKDYFFKLIWMILLFFSTAYSQEQENNGQDFTKPVGRFDKRFDHQNLPGPCGNFIGTLRGDIPFNLGDGWKFAARAEASYMWTNQPLPSASGILSHKKSDITGLTDAFTEFSFILPPGKSWAFGFGTQVIYPTANHELLGSGKYQLSPGVGLRYDLDSWMNGAWCALIPHYTFDVAGDVDRDHISQLIVQPVLNVNLPQRWFISFYSETRYDLEKDSWYFPLETMVGKILWRRFLISIDYRSAVINKLGLSDQEFEYRVGMLFP